MAKRLSKTLAKRNNWICALCKTQIVDIADASIDHIVPKSKGGDNSISNYQIAHRRCNSIKGSDAQREPEYYLNYTKKVKTVINRRQIASVKMDIICDVKLNENVDKETDYCIELYNEIQRNGMKRLSYKMFRSFFLKFMIVNISKSSVKNLYNDAKESLIIK